MDPVTLALIGTGFAAAGSLQQGLAGKAAGDANADLARIEGEAAFDAGLANELAQRRETARLLGRQRAGFAKAGVGLEGSPLLVMAETAAEGELLAQRERHRGEVARTRAANEAAIAKAEGRAALVGGVLGAGASILTGASSLRGLGGGSGGIR